MTPKDKDTECDSWDRYQLMVLAQLENVSSNLGAVTGAVEKLSDRVNQVQVDVAKLNAGHASMSDVKRDIGDVKESVKTLTTFVQSINREVGELQIKSGAWGALSGAISGALVMLGKMWKFGG